MKKKFLSIFMIVVMLAALTGCKVISIEGEDEETQTAGNGSIGLSVSTQNNPFFVDLAKGAQAAADAKGVELIVVDAGDDAAKQTNDVEDLVSKNVSVIIVNPVDSDAIAPEVNDALAKGIKVISVDRQVTGAKVDCQIASDNVAGAEMATEYLKKLVGNGAKVAELQGQTGASATIDRGQGFHNVADKSLNVVASQTASFDRAKGLDVMTNILQSNGSIVGVFAHNDEMALGAVQAIESAGKKIKVVGFDATDDALDAIKAGKMAATVAQQPDKMGATAIETAIKLIAGQEVEKNIPVEVKLITE